MTDRTKLDDAEARTINTLRELAALSPLCAILANELARLHGIRFSAETRKETEH